MWDIPPWLSLHTQCVSELSAIISTGGSEQTQVAFEAALFLFRLSVLLADGNAARMHHKALLHLAPQVGRDPGTLKTELAVLRDNIVNAFVHHSATVVVSTRSRKSGRITRQFVRMDKGSDWHERDWHNCEAILTAPSVCLPLVTLLTQSRSAKLLALRDLPIAPSRELLRMPSPSAPLDFLFFFSHPGSLNQVVNECIRVPRPPRLYRDESSTRSLLNKNLCSMALIDWHAHQGGSISPLCTFGHLQGRCHQQERKDLSHNKKVWT